MNPQIRNPMERMYRRTFYYNFENKPILCGRSYTWLCYEVKIRKDPSKLPWDKGVFRGQVLPKFQSNHRQEVDPETHCHAEMCFLSWFCDDILTPNKNYEVTWYTSWSPCPECAGEVAEFLARHSNVNLTIFTARLYYFWNTDYQEGLRSLSEEGASVEIMEYKHFKYCWENFVYNDDEPFKPWKGLKTNFRFLERKLWEIIK
ncbi:DNA dC-_dU-editing enzyme APOBEC-3D isoform X3 [Nomascus leucogenys]|uniref:DNA dC->dU-editing enzyme APOBEC-3D isoform X3 n=1 Tax=Nomascus leucogenys TaxID=61853 RepID=UPI00122DAF97|nr:DNA dC->dU-editing enzyme APOBEC-3D isoform X3 [Nomascus leucogenys]